jgi:hypothetical protein
LMRRCGVPAELAGITMTLWGKALKPATAGRGDPR